VISFSAGWMIMQVVQVGRGVMVVRERRMRVFRILAARARILV